MAGQALNGCPINQYHSQLYQAFDNRESALFHAVKLGYLDVVERLIEAGVNVNERNPIHPMQTPLMKTCYAPKNRGAMVKALVAAGADVNAKEYEAGKFTAAHICVWFDETEALKALIDAGHSQSVKNKDGRTIHSLAV